MRLLGVPIDAVTREQTTRLLLGFLTDGHQHHVATPNNEMLVEASSNVAFRDMLQRTDLNLPDTTGLIIAAHATGQRLPERVTGVDTVARLCVALTEEQPVFLLGAAEGVAAKAAETLKKKNEHLRIAGTFSGSPRDEDAVDIVRRIKTSGAHILLVAYGAPAQDLWIGQHLAQMPDVRLAMGIGGTFDFLAGVVRRAPPLLRSLGLEWLWRLCLEPKRWRRIVTAVIVFPGMIARYGKDGPE